MGDPIELRLGLETRGWPCRFAIRLLGRYGRKVGPKASRGTLLACHRAKTMPPTQQPLHRTLITEFRTPVYHLGCKELFTATTVWIEMQR